MDSNRPRGRVHDAETMRLRTKILLCALVNVALLASAVAVFVRYQFRPGVESILLAPGEARLVKLADQLTIELKRTPVREWDAVLARYAQMYGVDLGITLNPSGDTVAGTIKKVPPELSTYLQPAPPSSNVIWVTRRASSNFLCVPLTPRPISLTPQPAPLQPQPRVSVFRNTLTRGHWFGVRMTLAWPESEEPATLLVRSSSIIFRPLLFDSRPWLGCLGAIAGITLACWIPLIRGLTKSVRKITAAAGEIAEGHFDVQTGIRRRDEIGQLNDTIHRVAGQLHEFVTGQRRFLGDISHELCTPIARARVALGVLEEHGDPAQKRYVETAAEEIEHMSGLVNELLQFSKAGLAVAEAAAEPVVIGEVIARVIEREAEPGSDVRLIGGAELTVMAQPAGLFRAVSNLVRNAVRYAGADGPIVISSKRDGDFVILSVEDQGPGLPEEALDRVFTPFYRLDDSRSRESGGVGLGLAMVKTLVEASGGTVSCRNLSPQGLEVSIRLRQFVPLPDSALT